ncbi:hypothetical protein WICPIJ_002982 [Wickerhamomyces pijperi]|uniref:Large ribosomal subunit protein mL53 n=1 Tax=Wickerhamomyces pijperi TaxID=599730 RepID=A0A9P8Q7Y7_WICPI|nr:hypothetical protein WICPIJ_002982 [Wickerhamomyces pijperi]
MITKYFTKVVIRFNPLAAEGKPARLFLSAIPPSLKGACVIDSKVLKANDTTEPVLKFNTNKLTTEDKKTLEIDPSKNNFGELAAFFDRHSRQLQVKDSIEA